MHLPLLLVATWLGSCGLASAVAIEKAEVDGGLEVARSDNDMDGFGEDSAADALNGSYCGIALAVDRDCSGQTSETIYIHGEQCISPLSQYEIGYIRGVLLFSCHNLPPNFGLTIQEWQDVSCTQQGSFPPAIRMGRGCYALAHSEGTRDFDQSLYFGIA